MNTDKDYAKVTSGTVLAKMKVLDKNNYIPPETRVEFFKALVIGETDWSQNYEFTIDWDTFPERIEKATKEMFAVNYIGRNHEKEVEVVDSFAERLKQAAREMFAVDYTNR